MPPAGANVGPGVQPPNNALPRRSIADFFLRTWHGNILAVTGLVFTVSLGAWTIYSGILGLRYGALQTCATLYSIEKFSDYCNKILDTDVTPAPKVRRHLTDVGTNLHAFNASRGWAKLGGDESHGIISNWDFDGFSFEAQNVVLYLMVYILMYRPGGDSSASKPRLYELAFAQLDPGTFAVDNFGLLSGILSEESSNGFITMTVITAAAVGLALVLTRLPKPSGSRVDALAPRDQGLKEALIPE